MGLLVFISVAALMCTLGALAYVWRLAREQQQSLARIERDLEKAQKHLRRRAQMAQELAHEIKNPIGAIVASAEALEMLLSHEIAAHHREALGHIKDYGSGLLRQVSDFLDLTRAEGGLVRARPERVPLYEAVRSVVGLLSSAAIKRGVTLQVHGENDTLAAYVDPTHFKQILFNLVHNAVKFSPRKGTVDVAVQQVGSGKLVAVSVADQGSGIPSDIREMIFEPHVQGRSEVESEWQGYGLGLAVCKSLVEMAGGSITVHSEEGQGSTFVVTLPTSLPLLATQATEELPAMKLH